MLILTLLFRNAFFRAMSVEQFPNSEIARIMLELENRTGSSELSRIEFALWGHTTNPSYDLENVVTTFLIYGNGELPLRQSVRSIKKKSPSEAKAMTKKSDNFLDYSDMNMRYLRISGVLQRKGRGLMIVPTKHILAEKLAKATASTGPIIEQYRLLCSELHCLPTMSMWRKPCWMI